MTLPLLNQISDKLQSAAGSRHVVAVRNSAHQHISGVLWQEQSVVTSDQAVSGRDRYEIVTPGGDAVPARIAGRDAATNLLLLTTERPVASSPVVRGVARPGMLVLALGADAQGTATVRLGVVNAVGPQWYSQAGGRIDQRVSLDIRLGRTEEGGAVIDASGALLGMSTLGAGGEVLVIPCATIERVVPQLLRDGRVVRGWLGLALQPVAVPDALRDAAGQATGMMVMSVAAEGPGAAANLAAGDILLTVDGTSVKRARQIAAQLDDHSIGKAASLRLLRAGAVVTLEAMIAARPAS
ncbi:MAG TPA: S1C family serine protease [Povalibacter sp.]|nr:S1C family serine protease [Povalibacter sp.]